MYMVGGRLSRGGSGLSIWGGGEFIKRGWWAIYIWELRVMYMVGGRLSRGGNGLSKGGGEVGDYLDVGGGGGG